MAVGVSSHPGRKSGAGIACLVLMMSVSSTCLRAEEEEGRSDWKDLKLTFQYVRSRFTHPTQIEVLTYVAVTAGAFSLESNKYQLAGGFRKHRSRETDELSRNLGALGGPLVPVAALSTYFLGRLSGSSTLSRTGLILTESALFTFVATEIGQFVIAEKRPYQGGDLRWMQSGGHGVSGHTSIVAAMSVPLDRMFLRIHSDDGRWKKTFKFIGKGLVYGAPVAVGWSRMNDDLHYAWNVALGLGLGWKMGGLVSSAHGYDSSSRDHRGFELVPIASDGGSPGLAFKWSR